MISRLLHGITRANLSVIFDSYKRELPQATVEGIAFYGSPDLASNVRLNLSFLEEADRYGWSLVKRYIHSVVVADWTVKSGFVIGCVFENPKTSHLAYPQRSPEFCAFLVRTAVLHRLLQSGCHGAIRRKSRGRDFAAKIEARSRHKLQTHVQVGSFDEVKAPDSAPPR